MATASEIIQYQFSLPDEALVFDIEMNQASGSLLDTPADPAHLEGDYPDWTYLSSNQCSHCPLKTADCNRCPAAVRVHEVLDTFKKSTSIERVQLKVITTRRTFQQDCDLQTALNSMLGLQMATSGCPILSRLRAMANFHLPLSTFEETLYRSVSAYLTQQYFIHKKGGKADWDLQGLKAFYKDLEILNQAFSMRIQAIEQSDAVSNAIVLFFASSIQLADAIEDGLEEFEEFLTGKSAN